ncbi:unnamed protein product, partial [Dovyalis caffra]
ETKLLPLLRGHDLIHHIDGTMAPLAPTVEHNIPNLAYVARYCQDKLVLNWSC